MRESERWMAKFAGIEYKPVKRENAVEKLSFM